MTFDEELREHTPSTTQFDKKTGGFRSRVGEQTSDIATAALSMGPSLLLPFVVSLAVSLQESDALLAAMSIYTALYNIVSINIELYIIGVAGALLQKERCKTLIPQFRNYVISVVVFTIAVAAGVYGLLVPIYGSLMQDLRTFVVCAAVLAIVPVLSSISAIYSGHLIAWGSQNVAIATQGLRGVCGISLLPLAYFGGVPVVCIGICIGELVRVFITRWYVRKGVVASEQSGSRLSVRPLGWQASASAVAQFAPATDRSFLAAGPVGSITIYELADKIYYAVIQLLNLSILVRMVAGWSRLTLQSEDARARFRKDLVILGMLTGGLAVPLVLMALFASRLPFLPELTRDALEWSIILIVALPFSLWYSGLSRWAILHGRQRILMVLTGMQAVANLILNILFFSWFGAIGVVVATSVSRVVPVLAAAIYLKRRRLL